MARNYRRNALDGGVYINMPGTSTSINGSWKYRKRRRARPLAQDTMVGSEVAPIATTQAPMRSYRTRGTPAPGPTYARSNEELDTVYDRGQAIDADMSTDYMNDPRVTQQMGENFLKGRYGERYNVGRDQLEFELKAAQARKTSLESAIAKGTSVNLETGKAAPVATGVLKGDLERANVDIARIEADLGAKGKPWTPEERQQVMQRQAQRTMQGLYDQMSQTNDPLRKAALQRQIQEYASTFNAQQRQSASTRTQMAEVHKREGLGKPLRRDKITGELQFVDASNYSGGSGAFSGDTAVPTQEGSSGMGWVDGRPAMPDTSSYGQYTTMPGGYGDVQGQLNRLTGLMSKPAQFSTNVERAERRDLVREITSTLSDNVMNYPETLQREILTLNSAARKNYPPEALEKYIHSVAKRAMQFDAINNAKMSASQSIQAQRFEMQRQREEQAMNVNLAKEQLRQAEDELKSAREQRKEMQSIFESLYGVQGTEAGKIEDPKERHEVWLRMDAYQKEIDAFENDVLKPAQDRVKQQRNNLVSSMGGYTEQPQQDTQTPQNQEGEVKQPSPVNPSRPDMTDYDTAKKIIKSIKNRAPKKIYANTKKYVDPMSTEGRKEVNRQFDISKAESLMAEGKQNTEEFKSIWMNMTPEEKISVSKNAIPKQKEREKIVATEKAKKARQEKFSRDEAFSKAMELLTAGQGESAQMKKYLSVLTKEEKETILSLAKASK